ncbi:MAG: alpha/beta hydrolase [Bacteroidota bacterium]
MPHVVANGVRLHVQRLGAEGPPVVLIHGLVVGSMATWYFGLAAKLAEHHRVLLYDLRGHGGSERTQTGYDVGTMAEDLSALLADSFDEPVIVAGYSYGALVALRFALDAPERVSKLALVEAPLPPSAHGEVMEFLSMPPEKQFGALSPAMRRSVSSGQRRARRLAALLQFHQSESSLVRDLQETPDVPDHELAALHVPTLCLYGQESPCRDVGDRLAAVLPNARLASMTGGHRLVQESPGDVTAVLLDFTRGDDG